MGSDVNQILVFAQNGQVATINNALQALDAKLEITVVDDLAQAPHYLAMGDKWSLILCSMLMFSMSGFRRSLQQARTELLAPVIVLQSPSQHLTVDAVYDFGADDIINLGNNKQLCAVAKRELAHARNLRVLQGLRGELAQAIEDRDKARQAAVRAVRPTVVQQETKPEGQQQTRQEIQGEIISLDKEQERIYRLLNSRAVTLQYQGIATIASHDSCSAMYEVFVRLLDGEGDLVYPDEFFPIARQFKLMPRIDLTVVQQAIAVLEEQFRRGEKSTRLFIKLTEETVEDPRYCNGIISLINSARIAPGSLVIELGKESFLNSTKQVNVMHAALKRRGHVLSYDACAFEDCEKMQAYSPMLGYLKLNRPVIDGIVDDTHKRNRLTHFIACASGHGLKTIASRIEHADVLPVLYAVGVTHIQGYFVGAVQYEPSAMETIHSLESYDTPMYCLN